MENARMGLSHHVIPTEMDEDVSGGHRQIRIATMRYKAEKSGDDKMPSIFPLPPGPMNLTLKYFFRRVCAKEIGRKLIGLFFFRGRSGVYKIFLYP
jgi:hypothetical protein